MFRNRRSYLKFQTIDYCVNQAHSQQNHRVSWNFKGRKNVSFFVDPGTKVDSHCYTKVQKFLLMQGSSTNFTLDKLNKEK